MNNHGSGFDDLEPKYIIQPTEQPSPERTLFGLADIRADLIDELGRLDRPDLQARLQECGNSPGARHASTGCGLFTCQYCESKAIGELAKPVEEFLDSLDAVPPDEQRTFISMTMCFNAIPADWRYYQDGVEVLRPVNDWFVGRFLKKSYNVPSCESPGVWETITNRHIDVGAGALFYPTFRRGVLCYETVLWVKPSRKDEHDDPISYYVDMWENHARRKFKVRASCYLNDVRESLSSNSGRGVISSFSESYAKSLLQPATFISPQQAAGLLANMPPEFERLMPVGKFGGHAGLLSI